MVHDIYLVPSEMEDCVVYVWKQYDSLCPCMFNRILVTREAIFPLASSSRLDCFVCFQDLMIPENNSGAPCSLGNEMNYSKLRKNNSASSI